jgi:ATP-dependent Clp protease, protease subunit
MVKKLNVKGVIIPNENKWIYDWFEVENTTPNDIVNELPKDGSPLEIIINSPGGDVYAGSEIYTMLKDYHGKKTGKIVGIAASAASVIAMAVDNLLISPTAQIMIHNVSSIARGDYRDLQHEAAVLENWNKSIANAYQLKSGKPYDELLSLMDNETWLNAQQALDLKLVDGIMFQNSTPQLVASLQSGILPPNIVEKMRNMKGELSEPKIDPVNPVNQNKDLDLAKEKLKNTILGGYKYVKKC